MAISREDLIEHLTEVLLVDHGFEDSGEHEWDPEDPESQYSIIRDDVECIIEVLEDLDLISVED